MRKLASLRKIHTIQPIENADAIEVAMVDGWQVVVKKGEFAVDDLVVYLEIDSWVPTTIAPFLSKGKEPRKFKEIEGERLRTIKLRGCLSQGLLLKPTDLMTAKEFTLAREGDDLTQLLNIQLWECPLPAQMVGQAKGYFPQFLSKTDQERVQNLRKEITGAYNNKDEFEVTLKLDGSSITTYFKDGEIGICSRNLELKLNEYNQGNTFIKTAHDTGLVAALNAYGRNIAVQGELMGPGIQGNRENLTDFTIFVFDIFDIDMQKYLAPAERMEVFFTLCDLGYTGNHCPIINTCAELPSSDTNVLLKLAEGPSINNATREGLVYKRLDGQFSFKTISNQYLLKEK